MTKPVPKPTPKTAKARPIPKGILSVKKAPAVAEIVTEASPAPAVKRTALKNPIGRPRKRDTATRDMLYKAFRITPSLEVALRQWMVERKKADGVKWNCQAIYEEAIAEWFAKHKNNAKSAKPIEPLDESAMRGGLAVSQLIPAPMRMTKELDIEVEEFMVSDLSAGRRWTFQSFLATALSEWMKARQIKVVPL